MTDDGIMAFSAKFATLTELNVSRTKISSQGLKHVVQYAPMLKKLCKSSNKMFIFRDGAIRCLGMGILNLSYFIRHRNCTILKVVITILIPGLRSMELGDISMLTDLQHLVELDMGNPRFATVPED